MRLAVFADIHGAFAVVDEVLARLGPVDALILAGDLTTNGTPDDVTQAVNAWRARVPELFAVSGNMDSPAIDARLAALGVSIDGQCRRLGDTAFFGCSAAPVSIGTPYEIPEAEIAARIERGAAAADGAARRVFVPHAPPQGVADRTWTGVHAGSRAVRAFIDRAQPDLVLCGHIHEARGEATLGRTRIVNCGPARKGHYVVVDLDATGCRVEMR